MVSKNTKYVEQKADKSVEMSLDGIHFLMNVGEKYGWSDMNIYLV